MQVVLTPTEQTGQFTGQVGAAGTQGLYHLPEPVRVATSLPQPFDGLTKLGGEFVQ